VPESEDPDEVTKDAIEVIVNTGHEQVTSEYDTRWTIKTNPRKWLRS
jgi:hypothetical protein